MNSLYINCTLRGVTIEAPNAITYHSTETEMEQFTHLQNETVNLYIVGFKKEKTRVIITEYN